MNKKLTVGIILVAIIGFGVYSLINRIHKDVAAAKEDVSFTAKALVAEFEQDEGAANTKYLDKVIKVNGVIKAVENNDGGEISVILAADNEMSSVICNFEPAFKDSDQLKSGHNISVKGLCSGYLMDVVLDRCVIAQ